MSGRRSKKNQKLGSSRRGNRGLRVDNNEFEEQDEVHTTNQSDDTIKHAQFDHLPSLSSDNLTSVLECSLHAESQIHKDLEVEAELPERKRKIGSTRKKTGGSKSGRNLQTCDEVRTTEEFDETQLNTSITEEHTYSIEHEQRNAPSHLSQQTQKSGLGGELGVSQNIKNEEMSLYSQTTSLASYEVESNMVMEQSTAQSNVVTLAETDQENLLGSTLQKRKMGSTRRPLRGNREVQGLLRNKTDLWKAEVKSSSEAEFSMLDEMMQTWDDVKRKESPTNTSSHTESAFVPDEQVEVGGFSETYQDVPDSRHDTNTSEDCSSVQLDKTKEEPCRHDPMIIISSSKQDIEIDKLVVNVEEPLSSLCPFDSDTKDDNFEISTDVLTAQVSRISETLESDITHIEHTATDSDRTNSLPDSHGLEDGEKETLMESSTSGQEMKIEEEYTQSKSLDHKLENVNIQVTDDFVEQEIQFSLDKEHSPSETNVSDSLLISANCNLANLSPVTGCLHADVNLNSLLPEDSKSSFNVMAETAVCSFSNDVTINNEQSDPNVPEVENVAENPEIYVAMNEENNIDVIETSITCDVTVTEMFKDVENFTEQGVDFQTLATRENECVGTETGLETDAFEKTDQDNVTDDIMTQEFVNERENKEEQGDTTVSGRISNQEEQPTSQIQESYDFIQGTFEENAGESLLNAKSECSDFDKENETCEKFQIFEDFDPLAKCQNYDVKLDLQTENLSSDVHLEALHASENAENLSIWIDSALNLQDAVTESSLEFISIIPEDSYGEQKKDRYSEGVAEEDKGPEFHEQNNVIDDRTIQTSDERNDKEHEIIKTLRISTQELCDDEADEAEGQAEITSEQQTKSSSNISQIQDDPPQDDSKNMLESEAEEMFLSANTEQVDSDRMNKTNDEVAENLTYVNIQENESQSDLQTEYTQQYKVIKEEQNKITSHIKLEKLQETEHAENVSAVTDSGLSFEDVATVDSGESHTEPENISETPEDSQREEKQLTLNPLAHKRKMGSTRRPLRGNKGQRKDREQDDESLNNEEKSTEESINNNTESTITNFHAESQENAGDVESVPVEGDTDAHSEIQTEIKMFDSTDMEEKAEENIRDDNVLIRQVEFVEATLTVESNMTTESDHYQNNTSLDSNQEAFNSSENVESISAVTDAGLLLKDVVLVDSWETVSEKTEISITQDNSQGDTPSKLNPLAHKRKMGSTRRPLRGNKEKIKSAKEKEDEGNEGVVEEDTDLHSGTHKQNNVIDDHTIQTSDERNDKEHEIIKTLRISTQELCDDAADEAEGQAEITSEQQTKSSSNISQIQDDPPQDDSENMLESEAEEMFLSANTGQAVSDRMNETKDERKEIEDLNETEVAKHLKKVNIQDNESQSDLQTENPEQDKALKEEQNDTSPHINLEELQETEHAKNVSAVTASGESHTVYEYISEIQEDSLKDMKLNPVVHKRKMGSTRRPLRGNKGQRKDREQDNESLNNEEKSTEESINENTESQTITNFHAESQENAGDVESLPVGGDTDAHSEIQTEIKMFDSTDMEEKAEENICDDNVLMRQVEFVEATLTVESNMTTESDHYQNNTSLDSNQEALNSSENVETISAVTDAGLLLKDVVLVDSWETVSEKTEISITQDNSQGDTPSKLNPLAHKRKMGSTRRPLRGNKEKIKSAEEKEDEGNDGVVKEDTDLHSETHKQNNVIDDHTIQISDERNDKEHEIIKTLRISTQKLCDDAADEAEGEAEITSEQQTKSSSNIFQIKDDPPEDDSENMLESVRVVEEQEGKTQNTAANDEATESLETFTPENINSVTVTPHTQNQLFIQTIDENIQDFTQTVKDVYEESGGNKMFLRAITEHAAFDETNDESKESEEFKETEVAENVTHVNIQENESQSDLQTEDTEQYKVIKVEPNKITSHINPEKLQETEHAETVSAVTDSGLSFEDVATVDSGESHTEPENISETPEDSQREEKQSTLNPLAHKRKMGSTRRPLRGNKGQRKDREQDDESLNNEEKSSEESVNDNTESQTITNFHAESQDNAGDVESVPVGGDTDAHSEIQTEIKMFDSTDMEERTEENICDDNVLIRQVEFVEATLTVESNMTTESDHYQNNTSLDSNQEALNSSENVESISAVTDAGLLLKDVVLVGSWETVSEKTEISITQDNSQGDTPSKLNPLAHKRKMGSTRRPLRGNKEKIKSAKEKEDEGNEGVVEEDTNLHSNTGQVASDRMNETNDERKEIEDLNETEVAKHLRNVNIHNNESQSDLQTENPEQDKVLKEEQNDTSPHINLEKLQETEHAKNVSAVTDSGESHTVYEYISEIQEDSLKDMKLNPVVHKRKMGSTRRPLRGNKGKRKDREQDDESLNNEEKSPEESINDNTESQTITNFHAESQENAGDVESVPVGGDTDAHSEIQTEIKMFDSTDMEERTEENIRDDNVLMRQVEFVEATLTVESIMTTNTDQKVIKTHENVENISTVTDSGFVLQDGLIESILEINIVPEKAEDSHSKLNPIVHKRKMGSTRRPLRGNKEKEDLRKAKDEDMEPHSEIQEQNDVTNHSMIQKITDERYNEEETSETVRISIQELCDPSEIENKEWHRESTLEQEQRSSSNETRTQSGPSQDDAYEIVPEIQERRSEFKSNPLVLSDALLIAENQLHVSSKPAGMVGSPETEDGEIIQSVFSRSGQKRKMGSTRKTQRGQRMEKEREFGEEHDGEQTSTNENIIKPENLNLEEVISLPMTGSDTHQQTTSLDPNEEGHDIKSDESKLGDQTENAEQTQMLVKEQNDSDSNSNTNQVQSGSQISTKSENIQSNIKPTPQKRKMGSTRKTLRGNERRRQEVESKEMDEDSERTSEGHPTEFLTSKRESKSILDENTKSKESRSTENLTHPEATLTIFSESVVSEENLRKSQTNEAPTEAFSKTDLQLELLVSACDLKVDENDHSENSGPSEPEKLDQSRNLKVESEHKLQLTVLDQSHHVIHMEKHPQSETITPERRRKMGSTRKNFRGKQEEKKREESESKQFAPREDQDGETSVVRQAECEQIIDDSYRQTDISLLSEIERALNKTSQSSPDVDYRLNITEPNFANTPIETSHYNTPENSELEQGSDKEKYVSLQVTESRNPEISSPGRRRKMGSTRKNPREQLQVKRKDEDIDRSEDEMAENNKQEPKGLKKDLEAAEESKMHDTRDQEGNKEYLDVPITFANSSQMEESQEKTSPSTKRKFGSRRTNIGKRDPGGLVLPESDGDVTEDAGAQLVSLDKMIKATPHDRSPGKKQTADLKNISDMGVDQFNVVMVGNSCVGKTSFIRRFYRGQFSPDYSSTIGVDTCVQNVVLHDRVVKLHIWDTAGQERFHSITTQVFHRADGLLLMYEITSSKSFISVRDWISQVQEKAPNDVIMMLLGNKNDCAGREVQVEEGEALAREYKIDFMECSAATGDNVHECMKSLAELLVQRKRRRMEEHTALKREQPQKKSGCC